MNSTFTVMGNPQAKQRARQGRSGRFYTPKETRDYEHLVGLSALAAGIKCCYAGPVEVEIKLYLPDKRRRDLDNMAKGILDGLNGIAWRDDTQVVRLVIEKRLDQNPRAEVTLTLGFPTL